MSVLRITLLDAARRLAVPLAAGVVAVIAIVLGGRPPRGVGPDVAATTALWLHLPAFIVSAAAIAAALESWPLFAHDRPGAGHLARLRTGPLHGTLAASAGIALALTTALAVVGIAFALLLQATDQVLPVRSHVPLTSGDHVLDSQRAHVALEAPDRPIRSVHVRAAAIGTPGESARLSLIVDGAASDPVELVGADSHEFVIGGRTVDALELRRDAGPGLALVLLAGSIRAELVGDHSFAVNTLLAAVSYVIPALLALALLSVVHLRLGTPTALVAGVGTLIAATALDATPNALAIQQFARGHWLLAENALIAAVWPLAAAALIILVAMWSERRTR